MNILTFAATNSTQSINKQVVAYATKLIDGGLIPDATVTTLDLNDLEMAIYSVDRQNEGGIPQLAHDFFAAIADADAVIVSFAEHNGGYTAAYKNLFDWASRIDMRVYQDKPTVFLSTSLGPGGGGSVLGAAVQSAPFFGNDVKASLAIPSFYDNFDGASGNLTNVELDTQFREAIASLAGVAAGAAAA